jgi:hypothetical protein
MRHSPRWVAGPVIASVLLLSACATVEEESAALTGGARVLPTGQVKMEAKAKENLGILSAPVRKAARGSQLVIPYAAVFYGPNGDTWTYTSPQSLIFERTPIVVDRIDGNNAFLTDGPRPGTPVVTQGTAELFGVEIGIDQ